MKILILAAAHPKRKPDAPTPSNRALASSLDDLVADVDCVGRQATGRAQAAHHIAGDNAQ